MQISHLLFLCKIALRVVGLCPAYVSVCHLLSHAVMRTRRAPLLQSRAQGPTHTEVPLQTGPSCAHSGVQVQEERGVLGRGGEREPTGEQQRHRGALRGDGRPEDAHLPLGHARMQAGPQRQGATP